MNKYKVNVSREDYGYIIIEASSEEEARERIDCGDYADKDYIPKNGGIVVEEVINLSE